MYRTEVMEVPENRFMELNRSNNELEEFAYVPRMICRTASENFYFQPAASIAVC